MKRILNMTPEELTHLTREELLDGIRLSEGRVVASETIGVMPPMLTDVTNAEFAASMGADLIILNLFDVWEPVINALPPCEKVDVVRKVKELTGRPVGINLEPVVDAMAAEEEIWKMSRGRYATVENAERAVEMGVDFIILTGNPGNGVTNDALVSSLKKIKAAVGDKIALVVGKMHASGILSESGENIITKEDVKLFIDNGADIVLFPAPGTVPGITMEYLRELISYTHSREKLAFTSIGTSQEGADKDTIRRIALLSKMAGSDNHHIGDSGYVGMALAEDIMAYSIALRGVRHTYHRMAQSIRR